MLPLLNLCVSNAGSNGFKTILTLKGTESLPQNLIFYPLNSLQPNKIDLWYFQEWTRLINLTLKYDRFVIPSGFKRYRD